METCDVETLAGAGRRLLARTADQTVATTALFLMVPYPTYATFGTLAGGIAFALFVLLATSMLIAVQQHLFGNSLGKYLFSVRAKPLYGAPDFVFYAKRELKVVVFGYACGLTILNFVAMGFQWYSLACKGATSYDKGVSKVVQETCSPIRLTLGVCVLMLPLVAVAYAVFMLMLILSGG
jgi:hypothetical protein